MAWGDEGQGHTTRSSKAQAETQDTPDLRAHASALTSVEGTSWIRRQLSAGAGRGEDVRMWGQLG